MFPIATEKIDIECDCGKVYKFTIEEALKNPSFTCSKCGTSVKVDSSNLQAELDSAYKQIKDMLKKF